MSEKIKNRALVIIMALLMFGTSVFCIIKEPADYSAGERRKLAEFPKLSAEEILSGRFMKDFEAYGADQFPCRDVFRSGKAFSELYLLGKADTNGLYTAQGHIAKNEYVINEKSLDNAAEKFRYIYETFLQKTDVKLYLSVIPDKNEFLAEESGHLSLDFGKLTEDFREKAPYMQYIDIYDLLSADDYYRTDIHWKQECITDAAERLALEMGTELSGDFTVNELSEPFYGVYYGQLALPQNADKIKYLTSELLDSCTVKIYSTGTEKESVMYNMEKAQGKDPYEMFLSGSEPLLTIENPKADTKRELVLFRDSFGSSIAPLLASGYSKITLVDIRYMNSSILDRFIDFDSQDVLFLYSSYLLNNSFSLRS